MNFNFTDKISKDFISVHLNIPEQDRELSLYPVEGNIEWELQLDISRYGIDSFKYDIRKLSINVLTELDDIEDELLFEVVKDYDRGYLFTICKEYSKNGEWIKEKQFESIVELEIEQDPKTEDGNRSQIFVKEVNLELDKQRKTLTLKI